MPLTDSAVHDELGALSTITHVSVHTAIPNASGDAEVTGGSYARLALTMAAASSRAKASSADLNHAIPAGTTCVALGLWTALSGGTFKGWIPVSGASPLKGVGTVITADISADTITSPVHGLAVDNRVVLSAIAGGSLPTGLSATTVYWVRAVTTDTISLSLTQGGAAVDITGKGALGWYQAAPEVFTNAGTLKTASGNLVLDGTFLPA